MCGIAGISGKWKPGALEEARLAVAHRGPDGSGIYENRTAEIGLIHTRLAILDLSPLGHQPMVSDDGRHVLVFNGEIYNFRELRANLIECGAAFRGDSDTEVLLQAYRMWGQDVPDFLRRLNGIFAFALWDANADIILIARDAIGVKPLYYSQGEYGCCFASETKALRPWLASESTVDTTAIAQYVTYLWAPGDRTPDISVKKLEPGHFALIKKGQISEPRRWYVVPTCHVSGISCQGVASDEQVATLLRQAVHRQMVADVPVGAFLSGGLDSSSIVAFAREFTPGLRCFTNRTEGEADEGFVDDLPYAQRVARHLGVHLDVVDVSASDLVNDVCWMVRQLDEPLADPAALNVYHISRAARQAGITVLLSGAGGDDLFTGYRRHQAEQVLLGLRWLPQWVWVGLVGVLRHMDQRRAIWRRASKLAASAAQSADDRLLEYFRWIRPEMLESLYSTAVRGHVSQSNVEAPMRNWLKQLPDDLSPLDRLLTLEQRFFLSDHNLTYTDKMSMAAGVEVRVPFLDLDLVEYAATLTADQKMRKGIPKGILKKAMEPWLPHDVIYRPKVGFGAPVRRWVTNELRELIQDTLSEDSIRRRGLFDPTAVTQLIKDNRVGRVDASYVVLSLLFIELWSQSARHAPLR